MNTDVGVWVWSTGHERGAFVRWSLGWAEDVFARVEEDELSRFRSTSGVSRVNRAAPGSFVSLGGQRLERPQ